MSSAYIMSCVCLGGLGIMKSVGKKTLFWGMPVLNWLCVDVVFIKVIIIIFIRFKKLHDKAIHTIIIV